ncbi:MAG: polysaccharide pyruvyl transferase family protein [Nitriliruptoraceae bacterium]
MKVLVAGWIGSTNLGDELVFAGVRRLLRPLDVQVAAISVDPGATRRDHGVGAVDAHDPYALTRAAGQADLLLFGGGGLLQDVSSPYNLPYHLLRPLLAAARGTPVVGVALGVGELTTSLGRWLTARSTHRFAAISVRDPASADLLASIGGPAATLAADAALLLPSPQVTPEDRLVVSLRPWASRRSWRPASSRGDATPQPEVEALAQSLDRTIERTGSPIRFVALQRDRDDAFHRRVAAAMQRDAVSFATPSLDELLPELASGHSLVAMRYHAAVGALLATRPAVQLTYSGKVAALARELGPAGAALSFDTAGIARVAEELERVRTEQHRLPTALRRLRARAERSHQMLQRHLTGA